MWQRIRDFLLLLPEGALRKGIMIFLALLFALAIAAMVWVHEIDDNLALVTATETPAGSSIAVAVAANLIDREVNAHRWTPNDPFFLPGAWLDRMPAYQRGILSALSRFAIEMSDQIGRIRGSSQLDPDLDRVAGLLKYPPDVWIYDTSVSWLLTVSSDKQYRAAMKALRKYNARLTEGDAVFERRADNLHNTIERITADLGSASAAIANRVDYERPWFDTEADILYYDVKGRMYAYCLLIKALREDFRDVIKEKQLTQSWDQVEASLAQGAELDNFFILNHAPDSQFFPNHLTAMGFYLLRARTQLSEISDILLK